jgi:hypothetical protein
VCERERERERQTDRQTERTNRNLEKEGRVKYNGREREREMEQWRSKVVKVRKWRRERWAMGGSRLEKQ